MAALETYGAWHPEGARVIKEVAKLAAKRASCPWPEEFRRFVQLVGVGLQRQNAVMIIRKMAE